KSRESPAYSGARYRTAGVPQRLPSSCPGATRHLPGDKRLQDFLAAILLPGEIALPLYPIRSWLRKLVPARGAGQADRAARSRLADIPSPPPGTFALRNNSDREPDVPARKLEWSKAICPRIVRKAKFRHG